jgi:hypothetical protein
VASLPETSIASVATRIDIIERPEPLDPWQGMTLGRGIDRHDCSDQFMGRSVSAGLGNYHLENVHLDGAALTFIQNGSKIKETHYLVPPGAYEKAGDPVSDLIALDPHTSYIMARAFPNYYHWMAQSIPTIDWSLRTLPPAQFAILSGHLNKWQEEALSILEYDRVPRFAIDRGRNYSIKSIDYCDFQNGGSSFEVSRVAAATFKRMAAAAMDQSPAEADIIYVARPGTTRRIAVNEAEVVKLLEAEGILAVDPGLRSVSRQINLFGKAAAIIGPHGAGLTNIVFCRPGTIFNELLPAHYLNPCFTRLAQAGSLTYNIDLFESEPEIGADPQDRGWSIDPDFVRGRIREIKQRVAALHPRPVVMPGRMTAMDFLRQPGSNPTPAPSIEAHSEPKANRIPAKGRSWLARLFS